MAFAVSTKLALCGVTAKRMIAPKASQGTTNLEYLRNLPGVTAPFPDVFDPANLSATASIKDLRRWRESELIHGRVAMLAAVGFVVQENIEDNQLFFPFAGRITGPAIYHFQQIQQGFWEPLLLAIGIAESYRVAVGWAPPVNSVELNHLREDYNMGDLGFDPLGLKPSDAEGFKDMQTKELNNGRLAMIAVAGFVVQELLFQREILTVGGFKEAMDQQPLDLNQGKLPPLPVQFPDRGLPNVNLPSLSSPPSNGGPDVVKTVQGFAPSLPNFGNAANPAPNFKDLPETAALSSPTTGLPDMKKLADSMPNRAVPQIPNFFKAGKE